MGVRERENKKEDEEDAGKKSRRLAEVEQMMRLGQRMKAKAQQEDYDRKWRKLKAEDAEEEAEAEEEEGEAEEELPDSGCTSPDGIFLAEAEEQEISAEGRRLGEEWAMAALDRAIAGDQPESGQREEEEPEEEEEQRPAASKQQHQYQPASGQQR